MPPLAPAPRRPGDGRPRSSAPAVAFGGLDAELRRQLGITNVLCAYVFLLDAGARVRWHGSGGASEADVETLARCAEELRGEGETAPQAGRLRELR